MPGRVERYDALVLSETDADIDEATAVRLLTEAWKSRERSSDDRHLLARLNFSGVPFDVDAMIADAARGVRSLTSVRLERALRPEHTQRLDRDAPDTLRLPSGRAVRLEYKEDGSVAVEFAQGRRHREVSPSVPESETIVRVKHESHTSPPMHDCATGPILPGARLTGVMRSGVGTRYPPRAPHAHNVADHDVTRRKEGQEIRAAPCGDDRTLEGRLDRRG